MQCTWSGRRRPWRFWFIPTASMAIASISPAGSPGGPSTGLPIRSCRTSPTPCDTVSGLGAAVGFSCGKRISAVDSRSRCARAIRFGFAASWRAMKKLSEQQIIGQQGVHLLGGRLLSVGLSFQSSGPLDAGIDGFLELRDPSTGEVRAQWITAQLKTQKEGRFSEETDESLSYICRQQDLDYWLGSNGPVGLFVARLRHRRIFWKAPHTCVSDADTTRCPQGVFDKTHDAS